MRSIALARMSAAVLVIGLLAACGSDPTEKADGDQSATSDVPEVTGAFGEQPTVEIPDGTYEGDLVTDVLEEGDGEPVGVGDLIIANFQVLRWPGQAETTATETATATEGEEAAPDGMLFDSFTGPRPQGLGASDDILMSLLHEQLADVAVESRVLLVLPPEEAFGDQGQPDMGVQPDDTLVFVLDVVGSFAGDDTASGAEVTDLDPTLPQVTEGEDGPIAAMPTGEPPTELVTEVLIQGDGPVVETGDLLVAQYRGQLWKDGSEFDSTWSKDTPASFPIGVESVIPGWDKGLVGQAVGSRVLLVIPPKEGYGEEGREPDITGDDTLVFVIDILGSHGNAQPDATPTTS